MKILNGWLATIGVSGGVAIAGILAVGGGTAVLHHSSLLSGSHAIPVAVQAVSSKSSAPETNDADTQNDRGVDANGLDDNGVDANKVDDHGVDANKVDDNGADANKVDDHGVDANKVDDGSRVAISSGSGTSGTSSGSEDGGHGSDDSK